MKKYLALIFALIALGALIFMFYPENKIKVGFIFLHDERSTYDVHFMNSARTVCQNLGVDYVLRTNVSEGQPCYETAVELAQNGCDLIFANSFGHEDFLMKAAVEFPHVEFCHATGTKAHTAGLENFHNAFAAIYEGRYLSGIAAGMKLNEMINSGKISASQAKLGYVGAFPYAEVISGYTAFYLGAKSICPSATMEVTFTNSWYDENLETAKANLLIDNGCVIISQHADSLGAPSACELRKVPNAAYNESNIAICQESFLISTSINWNSYFEYMISQTRAGKKIDSDWTGNLASGSVEISELNYNVRRRNC